MASATPRVRKVPATTDKEEQDGVTLELDHEEARVLRDVLSNVSGSRALWRVMGAFDSAGYRFRSLAIDGDVQGISGALHVRSNWTA